MNAVHLLAFLFRPRSRNTTNAIQLNAVLTTLNVTSAVMDHTQMLVQRSFFITYLFLVPQGFFELVGCVRKNKAFMYRTHMYRYTIAVSCEVSKFIHYTQTKVA